MVCGPTTADAGPCGGPFFGDRETIYHKARSPKDRKMEAKQIFAARAREECAARVREDWAQTLSEHHATVAASQATELDGWVQQRLAEERAALVRHLQERLSRHLCEHHRILVEEVEVALTAARPPASTSPFASLKPVAPGEARQPGPCASPRRSDQSAMGSRRSSWDHGSVEPVQPRTSGTVHQYTTKRLVALAHSATSIPSARQSGHCCFASTVKAFVRKPCFEIICSIFILLNLFVLAAEVQYIGIETGYNIGFPSTGRPAEEVWPGVATAFRVLPVAFTGLFAAELLLRIISGPRAALTSCWIWLDVAILVTTGLDAANRMLALLTDHMTMNTSMMRMARVARMLRTVKILRKREGFQSLFLLMKSIRASAHALLWSLLLLCCVMTVAGMLINQLLESYYNDVTVDSAEKREIFEYYGTYSRMMVTMFELTLGNWAPPKRLLMRHVSEWWGVFIVVYRCGLCFALVNVTAAVFITETTRVAHSDVEVAVMAKERTRKAQISKLRDLFAELDISGDGCVSWDEFQRLLTDEVMRKFLSTVELEVHNLKTLFKLLDDGDGKVVLDEFIHGIMTTRGEAKSVDLLSLTKIVQKMDSKLNRLVTVCR